MASPSRRRLFALVSMLLGVASGLALAELVLLYRPNSDSHPAAEGYAIISEVLAEALTEAGFTAPVHSP